VPNAEAETTFTSTTVESVDREHQQMTIRTNEGKRWSLEVAQADLMQGLKEGDRASVELALDGKVTKIVKSGSDSKPAE
jgi:ABC-type molybdate transport system ATPase subunit